MPEVQKDVKTASGQTKLIDEQERQKMIEEAAYFRASNKQFANDPMADWLAAEKEVDLMLAKQKEGKKREELAAFERLREETGRILQTMRGSLKEDTIRTAVEKAIRDVKELREFTSESINKGAEALKKDMARNIEKLDGTWNSVSLKTAGLLSSWSNRGAKFFKQAEQAANSWLKQRHDKVGAPLYRTGEIAAAGTFVCKSCGHTLNINETGHLPRCPQCDNTEFKLEA